LAQPNASLAHTSGSPPAGAAALQLAKTMAKTTKTKNNTLFFISFSFGYF
jgi:hypothetical protein